jgi:hypothetical protein
VELAAAGGGQRQRSRLAKRSSLAAAGYHRTMNRPIAPRVAAALLATCGLAAALAAPADATTRRWNVTAVLSGTYANAVTATQAARCAAHYAERVSGFKATFTSVGALRYDTVARAFTGRLRYAVTGRWSVAGGYVAQVAQPDGTLGCAAAETSVACGARVVFEGAGRHTSTAGTTRLAVDGNARGIVGSRIAAPRLTEEYADAGTPPDGWPGACRLSPDDETLPAAPLFGLSATEVLDRALARRIRFPTGRLAGHRRFVVHGAPIKPNGCPAQGFDPCAEQGSFALRVTVTPVR